MSHIVVYQADDGSSGYEPCNTLDDAVVVAERMRNVEGVESPRIFRMEEVSFDFRPYFRVEVLDSDQESAQSTDSALAALADMPLETDTEDDSSWQPEAVPTSIDSLDELEPSVEAFAAEPPVPESSDAIIEAATADLENLEDDATTADHESEMPEPHGEGALEAEPVMVPEEPDADNDPMVSVRRGLFGR